MEQRGLKSDLLPGPGCSNIGKPYPLDSDLSGGWHYPPIKQLAPDPESDKTTTLNHHSEPQLKPFTPQTLKLENTHKYIHTLFIPK